MNLHLVEIGQTVAPGAHAALVVDGAGWHVGDKLVAPDNISSVKLPPSAPELDPIETVWACLRGTRLAHRLFDSYDAIANACCDAWNIFICGSENAPVYHDQPMGTVLSGRTMISHHGLSRAGTR